MTTLTLGEIIKPAATRRAGDGIFPLLSMTMRNGLVRQGDKFKKRVASRDLSQYKVVSNEQLVVGFPIDEGVLSFQRIADHGIVSPAYGVWDLRNPAEVDTTYLEKFLRSSPALAYYAAKLRGSTARRRSLPNAVFLAMPVPLPPLPEQRRIVAILDKAESLRTQRREALAHLDALSQSVFNQMFGDLDRNTMAWQFAPIEELLTVGPQNGMYLPSSDYGSGTPIVRIDSFRNGVVDDLATLKRLRASETDVNRYGLNAGDVLINRVNSIEHLGKTAVVPALHEPTVFESNMMRCRFNGFRINNTFIRFTLQSQQVKRQILRSAKRAVNQASINQTDVKNFAIPLPPLERQQTFARRIAGIERLKEQHHAQLAELDALFVSLQHRAFTGTL